jgi:methyltransferase (TIGR00027 family)
MSLLIFLLLLVPFIPVFVVGGIGFTFVLYRDAFGKGFSMTAYDPFFARWIMHHLGTRHDPAAAQIAPHLPGTPAWALKLTMAPILWALQVSGYTLGMYDYHRRESSSHFDAFGQRTRFFDDALKAALPTVKQVVVLGAGWDTRAYGDAKHPNVRVFEVDTAMTQARKLAALAASGLDTSHVTYVAVDINTETWLDGLQRHGFDPTQLTFFLWEGVTYYLNTEAVAATLRTVAEQLAPGSQVAFDYVSAEVLDGSDTSLMYRSAVRAAARYNEPWTFGFSTDRPARDTLASELADYGLTLTAFETYGQESEQSRARGGLAVAVK